MAPQYDAQIQLKKSIVPHILLYIILVKLSIATRLKMTKRIWHSDITQSAYQLALGNRKFDSEKCTISKTLNC